MRGYYPRALRRIAAREGITPEEAQKRPDLRFEARRKPGEFRGALIHPEEWPRFVARFGKQLEETAKTSKGRRAIDRENRRRGKLRAEWEASEPMFAELLNIAWEWPPVQGHWSYVFPEPRGVLRYVETGPTQAIVKQGMVWILVWPKLRWAAFFEDYDREGKRESRRRTRGRTAGQG